MFSIATSTMIVIAILITKITLHVSIPVLYMCCYSCLLITMIAIMVIIDINLLLPPPPTTTTTTATRTRTTTTLTIRSCCDGGFPEAANRPGYRRQRP